MKATLKVLTILTVLILIGTIASSLTQPYEMPSGAPPANLRYFFPSYLNTSYAGEALSLEAVPLFLRPTGMELNLSVAATTQYTWAILLFNLPSNASLSSPAIGISQILIVGELVNVSSNKSIEIAHNHADPFKEEGGNSTELAVYPHFESVPIQTGNYTYTCTLVIYFYLSTLFGPYRGPGTEYHMKVSFPLEFVSYLTYS